MSKKACSKKAWTGVKQVVDMGTEVSRESMLNGVYSVLMLSHGDGQLNYKWGIVIVKDSVIIRNYNINKNIAWDANHCTLKNGWRVFEADAVSNDFAVTYLYVSKARKEIADTREEIAKVTKELERIKYENEHKSLWDRIMGK